MEKNTIPEMVNPLGKHWDQPSRQEITIDDKNALMSKHTLDKLKNYSHSIPSGVYEGKMWRSQHVQKNKTFNYLHWYGFSDKPDKCTHNYRDIILMDN